MATPSYTSLLSVLVVSCLHFTLSQPPPIPARLEGYTYKPTTSSCSAPIYFEAFVDPVCPLSKAAFPVYQKVADYYGPDKLRLQTIMYPLPYHRAAFVGAQGTAVANEMNPNLTYAWLNHVFREQAILYDDAIVNQTHSYVVKTYAEWAADVGYSQSQFAGRLARNDPADNVARIQWKYGTIRGIYGTPHVMLNGVLVQANSSWTLDDWRILIDPLL